MDVTVNPIYIYRTGSGPSYLPFCIYVQSDMQLDMQANSEGENQ